MTATRALVGVTQVIQGHPLKNGTYWANELREGPPEGPHIIFLDTVFAGCP